MLTNYFKLEKTVGMFLVLTLHGVLFYTAMSYQLIPPPQETVTLFVDLINPPSPKKEELPPELPKPQPQKVKLDKPRSVNPPKPIPVLATAAPVVSASEPVAPPPEPMIEEALPAIEPAPLIQPSAPVLMTSELSLACPQRTLPSYPSGARRLGEQGRVVLRVELNETGRITSAQVAESSGFKRLDEAGVQAVRSWQCNPAIRNGEAVKAVALQPFDFVIE